MLDGLLGRGFSSKCKSLIKLTRTRLDVIMRKRNAMQKYLKKDIADLLANGLDINAYGRAEGLSVELNLSFCYEFVEQLCEFIPKNLSVMQKQRECPEEFREAVSSLMFAAARFADLPELRDLRDLFRERYGSNLEAFANREFVDSLASKPPTTEKKLQLMQEIAQEFSIKWDSKAFKQQIANSPAQDQTKRQSSFKDPQIHGNKQHGSRDEIAANQDVLSTGRRGLSDDGYILNGNREETAFDRESLNVPSNRRRGISADGSRGEQTISDKDNPGVLSRRRSELTDDRYKQDWGSRVTNPERDYEYTDDRFKPRKDRDHITRKREKHDVLSRDDYTADGFKPHKVKDDTLLKRDDLENSYHGRRKHDTGRELNNGMEDTVRRRDKQDVSSYKEQVYPTTTHKIIMGSKEETSFAGDNHKTPHNHFKLTEKASNGAESTKPLPPPPYLKPNGGKYKSPAEHPDNKSERTQAGLDRAVYDDERRVVEPPRVNDQDYGDHQDDLGGGKKQKPKSVRRKHLKPPPGQDYRDNNEADEVVKRNPNGKRREDTRQGLQHALEDNRKSKDEDERMMDKLLMHYSKKPSKFEHVKVKEGLNPPPGHHDVGDAGEPQRHRRKDAAQVPPPSRAVSLPPEPVTPSEKERVPAPTRATSFQPEMMNPGAHVHPRLPDYDDLAARFAALRGR